MVAQLKENINDENELIFIRYNKFDNSNTCRSLPYRGKQGWVISSKDIDKYITELKFWSRYDVDEDDIEIIKLSNINKNKLKSLDYRQAHKYVTCESDIVPKLLDFKPSHVMRFIQNKGKSMLKYSARMDFQVIILDDINTHLKENYDKENNDISIIPGSDDDYNDILINNKKVGYIILSPTEKEYYWIFGTQLGKSLALVEINVLPEFRKKGVFKKVMEWLYTFAKNKGYDSIFLRVDDDSDINQSDLINIYSKEGFKIFSWNNDDDNVYMYKLINNLTEIYNKENLTVKLNKIKPKKFVYHKSSENFIRKLLKKYINEAFIDDKGNLVVFDKRFDYPYEKI